MTAGGGWRDRGTTGPISITGHSENNGVILGVSSPEIELETAMDIGPFSMETARRKRCIGQGGGGRGTGVEPSPPQKTPLALPKRQKAATYESGPGHLRWYFRRLPPRGAAARLSQLRLEERALAATADRNRRSAGQREQLMSLSMRPDWWMWPNPRDR